MRPLKLTMQAFGPYRAQETVDFGELGPNRVFLIHGDTGAGKTTILDAMVFALYGETSGGERRADQMRCESAPSTLATEVVFDFSLGADAFRVRRRPAQELTGARGPRVSKPAEATLWDRTGCAAEQEGRLLTTKITEANTIIRDTLGFSSEQFRQVVVLPQGRFRELLSAGSDKREEILRQLFKTARFRQLEEALADRAKAVRAQMQELKARRDAQLGLVDATDDEALAALAAAAASEVEAAAAAVARAAAASEAADDAFTAAEAVVEARRALAVARTELEALESSADEFSAVRVRFEAALRADKVQPAADRLADARTGLTAADAELQSAAASLAAAREAEDAAMQALAVQTEQAPRREAAADTLRRLEGLTTAIEAWRSAADGSSAAEACAEARGAEARGAEEAQVLAEQRLVALQQQYAAARAAAAQVEGAQTRLGAARQHEDRCRRLLAARDTVEAAEERHMRLLAAEADALEGVIAAESTLTTLEERWRAGRAAALAASLTPGLPCPVCGGVDHPAPAHPGAADASDDDLASARSAVESARQAHSRARDACAQAANDLTAAHTAERAIRQEPGAQPDLALTDAESTVAVCVAELAQLTAQAEVAVLEPQVAAAEAAATDARHAAKNAAGALAVEEKALAACEARLAERATVVPEELRSAGALEAAIEEARRTKKVLDEAFAGAQQRQSDAKESRAARESAAAAAAAALSTAAGREKSCVAALTEAFQKHGFPGEVQWRQAGLPEQDRATLEARLEEYGNALNQARGRLHQAESAVAGQPEPGDLSALRETAETARSLHSAAISRRAQAENTAGNLAKVKQALADIDARSEDVRQTYRTVGVLAEVANGNNPNRVSFQRWVLGVYLDEVLINASRKLFTMSKGRYRLQRQKEPAGRGRASGLDLAVFDEFSGSDRPAVTLSGGESFLAALALALGLAETVQEHAVGVPLETIFVDEGFGALDSDALELAIEALMELQLGGRLVGVISHVPELRQVIPARLEVRGGSAGSSARFVVP